MSGIGKYLWHEVLYNGKSLATIVMLSIMSLILENLQTAFEKSTVSRVAYTICYMVVLVIAVNSFSIAIGYARDAITQMIDFMMAMLPALCTDGFDGECGDRLGGSSASHLHGTYGRYADQHGCVPASVLLGSAPG